MSRQPHRSALTRVLGVATAVVTGLTLAGCGSGTSSGANASGTTGKGGVSSGSPTQGGTVSFAEPPNATPNWILPIGTPGHLASYNSAIQSEMFLPLAKFDNSSGSLALDKKASVLSSVSYSNHDQTVTVKLSTLKWSDGTPVSARDVQFWFNLIKANKKQWAGYVQGQLPDNVSSLSIVNPTTFKLQLTGTVNPEWFTANELTAVTPLPQQAWDVTSTGGKVGNYDQTPAGARKVFSYLVKQAGDLAAYASNPLWKVTDGPFKLGAFSTNGQVTLDKSKAYSGPDPAHLAAVKLLPFASASAEFNVLRAGGVDYGYIPVSDLSQASYLKSKGYRVQAWNGWAINYAPYNFNNPSLGPAFKQLYVRQAIQMGIDQTALAKDVWHGYATPVYGPVPQHPSSPFLSKVQASNPYPYAPSKAESLLKAHGWTMGPNKVLVCSSPGTAAGECGAGVAKGTALVLHMLSENGSTETNNQMQVMQSELSKIGVGFQTSYAPLNSVLSRTAQCQPSQPACSWQLSFFGTQGSWYFNAYPAGASIFGASGGSNFGNYNDKKANQLAAATRSSSNPSAMQAWSAYLAKQLPAMWLPVPAYQVSAIRNTLQGVKQDPLAGQTMQRWYLTKK